MLDRAPPGGKQTLWGLPMLCIARSSLGHSKFRAHRDFCRRHREPLWEVEMRLGNPTGWTCGIVMRRAALILGLAAVMALGFSAQVPAQGTAIPSVFDGEYTGTATPSNSSQGSGCEVIINPIMTIAGPQVTINTFWAGRPQHTYSGIVDPSGRVSASTQWQKREASNNIIPIYSKGLFRCFRCDRHFVGKGCRIGRHDPMNGVT
jgi:hypothetical protein